MPTTSPEAVTRHIQKHQQTMRQIAVREHVDLQDLQAATKYAGRNVEQMHSDVKTGLRTLSEQSNRIAGELESISFSLDQLVQVTSEGFRITIEYLNKISGQLDQMLEVLKYPSRTLGSEQREQGLYFASKGKPKLAIHSLQKAIKLNPRDFISLYSLGYLFASNQQYEDAASMFDDCALYADDNSAMSAQAAIFAAHCYKHMGERKKAWAVLKRTTGLNSPDLALPLMQNAHSESEVEFATKHLSRAFVTDAELVLAAEAIDLDFVENAAKIAHRQILADISDLKRTWRALAEVGEASGVFRVKDEPRLPAAIDTPQSKLMNAAIYRRGLQRGLLIMKDRLESRLYEPVKKPAFPRTASFEGPDGTGVRFLVSALIAALGVVFLRVGESHMGIVAFIIAIVFLSLDIFFFIRWLLQYFEYMDENIEYDKQTKSVASKNRQFELKRKEVGRVVEEANGVLDATMPPIVPRAFPGDLAAYTRS